MQLVPWAQKPAHRRIQALKSLGLLEVSRGPPCLESSYLQFAV